MVKIFKVQWCSCTESNKFAVQCFLGGISANFDSNVLVNKNSDWAVVEADEFDRSFASFSYCSIVTAMDPDHLDIYGDPEHFNEFSAICYENRPWRVIVLRERN